MAKLFGKAAGEEISGGAADDVIKGFGGNDSLWGALGHDLVLGGEGDDLISDDKDGGDTLVGGPGFDTFGAFYGTFFGGGPGAIAFTFVVGSSFVSPTGSQASGFERIDMTGSDFDDTITGGWNGDGLRGWQGNDRLDGARGDDVLIGDNGADTLMGGKGEDALRGGGGEDQLYGGDGDDTITGGNISDVFQANDTMVGGRGADTFRTGPQRTTIDYQTSREGIYLNLDLGIGYGGDAQGDRVLHGPGGVAHIIGSGFADYLIGGFELDGGAGDDRLEHGRGTDLLTGGEGVDAFLFRFDKATLWEFPTITDFEQGSEKIDLSRIDARGQGGDQAFTFIGTEPSFGKGEVRYQHQDGQTMIQMSGNFWIFLDGEYELTADDFVL